MDIKRAREMVRAAFRASAELQQLLPTLKASCPEAEYRELALGIAEAIDTIGVKLIDKAIAMHPELKARSTPPSPRTGATVKRVAKVDFLTVNRKRAAVGHQPRPDIAFSIPNVCI